MTTETADGIVNYGADRFEVQRGGRRFAIVDSMEDARVVLAAPALLAALEDAVRMLKAWDKEYGSQVTDIARMEATIEQARA